MHITVGTYTKIFIFILFCLSLVPANLLIVYTDFDENFIDN